MTRRFAIAAALLLLLGSTPAISELDAPRFRQASSLTDVPADWVTAYNGRLAFGSGDRLFLSHAGPPIRIESEFRLDRSVVDAVLAGHRLFLSEEGGGLGMLDLAAPHAGTVAQPLSPPVRAELRIARMDDYLLVAENGFGLRILALPLPSGHDSMSHGAHHDGLTPVAILPIKGDFSALAAAARSIYVAIDGVGLAVVDARVAGSPTPVRTVPLDEEVRALAANGSTVFVLGSGGLRILDTSVDADGSASFHPEVAGSSIYVAGRTLHVASGDLGVTTYQDQSALGVDHVVDVGDFFFDPVSLPANVGDTVEWQKPSTAFAHNVLSCTAAQSGCSGQAANESFTSGAPTTSPFNFQHTFTSAGSNPYVCELHTTSMQATVTVTASSPPPGVPDGSGLTTPMLVDKGILGRLDIFWDVATCSNPGDYQLLSGEDVQLPATFDGVYGLQAADSNCSIGTSQPFAWTPPNPAPGRYNWFVIVANDGSTVEGPWGRNSGAFDRRGPGTGFSSGVCHSSKTLANPCGQ